MPALFLEQLQSTLTPATFALVQHIATEADKRRYRAYLVGGPVRDMLLQRAVNDIDIVFEGQSIPLARALAKMMGGRVVTHERFGTATWRLDDPDSPPTHPLATAAGLPPFIDLITARSETYEHPAALPTVTFAGMKEDLFRRDFTVNTLALALNGTQQGELLDFYGGMTDLRNGSLRVLHDYSFIDDPTRILRAIRFEQRFGFVLEPRTHHLLQSGLSGLGLLSPDRLRHELLLIFQEPKRAQLLERLNFLGVLPYLLPAVQWNDAHIQRLTLLEATHDTEALLAALTFGLTTSQIEKVAETLGLPHVWRDDLLTVAGLIADSAVLTKSNLTNSEIYFALHKRELRAIEWVATFTTNEVLRARLRLFLDNLQHRTLAVNGDDIKALGVLPGRIYKTILEKIHAALLDGVITSEAEQRAMLEEEAKKVV